MLAIAHSSIWCMQEILDEETSLLKNKKNILNISSSSPMTKSNTYAICTSK